jgi:hypothetical protein
MSTGVSATHGNQSTMERNKAEEVECNKMDVQQQRVSRQHPKLGVMIVRTLQGRRDKACLARNCDESA